MASDTASAGTLPTLLAVADVKHAEKTLLQQQKLIGRGDVDLAAWKGTAPVLARCTAS